MATQVAISATRATTTHRNQMSQEAQRIGTLTSMLLRTVPVLCGVSITGSLSYLRLLHESLSATIVTYGLRLICRPKVVLSQLHGGRFGDILGARAHEFVHDAWSTMFAHLIRRFAFAFSSVAAVRFSLTNLHCPKCRCRL